MSEKSNTKWASNRRKQRQEQKIKRLKDKEGQRKHRQQNLTNFDTIYKNREHIYKNSIEKCRFLKKLKEVLPRGGFRGEGGRTRRASPLKLEKI